ncbi:leucine-rich repeat domain-containing protein [Crocinitomix catalasitica]|uniref:leucine-rich repeat domain-containing protein n=1 Tax=Crocinitomix catalasitica TaxID=184607 RepID=UPI000481AF09|nr:hypothetical protein [Crocinitomix catalasitica]
MKKRISILITFFIYTISFANVNDTIVLKDCDYNELIEICLTKNPKLLKIQSYKSDSLPSEIGRLTNLEHLDINFGEFHYVPKSIGNLHELKILTISNGRTKLNIPPEIGKLTNLIELNIYNYEIDILPNEIGNLVNLEEIMLCGKISSLPSTVKNWKSIRNLYLSGNNLKEIPSYFYLFNELEFLDLSNSNISFVSDSIKLLQQLKDLTLNGNIELLVLPEPICELENLERLEIENTMISFLPHCLSLNNNLVIIKACKEIFSNQETIEKKLNDKIKWSWRCRYLESQLINFSEVYGKYSTKLKKVNDTLYLESNYFYNEPGVIDEEFTRKVILKIHNLDSVKLNKIYEINNPLFQVETSSFSVWDWSNKKNYELEGYIVFREISNRKIIAYLNIELIENKESRKIIDKLLEYKK